MHEVVTSTIIGFVVNVGKAVQQSTCFQTESQHTQTHHDDYCISSHDSLKQIAQRVTIKVIVEGCHVHHGQSG